MHFPGKVAMWMNQTVDWLSPMFINNEIDVASQVVHLCSEESSYTNSINLPITVAPL